MVSSMLANHIIFSSPKFLMKLQQQTLEWHHGVNGGGICKIVSPDLKAARRKSKLKSAKRNDKVTTAMDPTIWGSLQHFISLERMVFTKLPLHEFFKAFSVCKTWNLLGLAISKIPKTFKQLFPLNILKAPQPFFILHGSNGCHQTMLTCDNPMLEDWTLKALPEFAFQGAQTSVSEGFVYSGGASNKLDGRSSVFNLHTKQLHLLPAFEEGTNHTNVLSKIAVYDVARSSYKVLVAMGCRTTMRTIVYNCETNKWTSKLGRIPINIPNDRACSQYLDGVLYIKWRDSDVVGKCQTTLFGYNFDRDFWSIIEAAPHRWHACPSFMSGLGQWKGRLYDVAIDNDGVLRIWRFDYFGKTWQEVDCMPVVVLEWLMQPEIEVVLNHLFDYHITVHFCNEYVLVSRRRFPNRYGKVRFVLYNMVLRSWKKIQLNKKWRCCKHH